MSRLDSALTVRTGSPRQRPYVTNRAKRGEAPADRIKRHVKVDENGCWIWQLAIRQPGYGRITIQNKTGLYAHRVSYEAFVGPIPEGLEIDHLCRVRACCNPQHLEAVTPQVNTLRGTSPGAKAQRRERCELGHLYAEHGVIRGGRRVCHVCRIAYGRIYQSMTRDQREERRQAGLLIVDLAAHFRLPDSA